LAVRKKEKGKQETGIVIHSWKQSNQQKPLVKIQSAQVVKIQSAPTDSYSKELDPAAPRKAKDTIEIDDRITMGKITFRALHRFEHIAENAARGRFPCSDPVALSEFNYPEIAQRLLKHTKWVKSKKLKWVENSKTAK